MRPLVVFDIETCGLADAEQWLGPVTAARNLKDPEKIAEDIRQRRAAQLERLSLDPYGCRIVAMGWARDDQPVAVTTCPNDATECAALAAFWRQTTRARLVGFNVLRFDLPVLFARSRLLSVPVPQMDLRRFGNRDVLDLYSVLTCDGNEPEAVISRSLHSLCRRFGLPVEDGISGREIPQFVADNNWVAIQAHVRSDVGLTRALAQRIGLWPAETADAAAM